MLNWTVTHSGSIRYGEAAVPGPSLCKASLSSSGNQSVRWLQANVTGASNIECVLEMKADISLLTEVRCSGKALGKECKRRNLVCTGRDSELERLAAVVVDPKIASEIKAELTKLDGRTGRRVWRGSE